MTPAVDSKSIGATLRDKLSASGLSSDLWLAGHSQIVKSDVHSVAGIGELAGQSCFIKLYRHKSRLRQWLPVLGQRRPRRAYRMAHALQDAGVRVPRPLAVIPMPEGVVVVTHALVPAQNLAQYWPELAIQQQTAMLAEVGGALATLHYAGFSHGDCKWHNLVFSQGQCYFVDLDSVRRSRSCGQRQARDFARFLVNAEELAVPPECFESFSQAYFAAVKYPREEFLHRVHDHVRQFRARHRERYGILGTQLL